MKQSLELFWGRKVVSEEGSRKGRRCIDNSPSDEVTVHPEFLQGSPVE